MLLVVGLYYIYTHERDFMRRGLVPLNGRRTSRGLWDHGTVCCHVESMFSTEPAGSIDQTRGRLKINGVSASL